MPVFDHQGGRHIDVAGARIYTQTLGPEDAPVLVLLHGGFGTIEGFNGLLPALDGWRLVGIDSRGHGASTLGGEPWTYQRVQEDVEQVLAALGVRRASLLGFSDGGIVALRLGAAGRLAIDRIAVIGATWHRDILQTTRPILAGVTAESWRRKFPDTYADYQRLNPEPDFDRFARAVVGGWLDETPSGHPDESVRRIQAPVLVVRGDTDHLVPLESTVALRQALPRAHLLNIPFAGHVAYEDAPEIFVPALRRFLKEAD
ncbi:alpha/beta fold hydrolase [Xylophilus sp.]|uniref:alpha/beta fold hydrolase n=1 Tax=Xylophilus sp. TaxID=2653893 RepID=UPI0013BD3CAC|nr:alpha/beta hydrolase [Xylophilus sp.]KAF1047963.1 MAG: Non-heme chloroperoxidase [Xylophilus sp.]